MKLWKTFLPLAVVALALAGTASAADPTAARRIALLAPRGVCPDPEMSAPARAQIKAMLCYHAYARRRLGVRQLRPVAPLDRSSALKARWIVGCRAFTHTPCGRSFITAFRDVDYIHGNWVVGENLAWGSGSRGTVRALFDAWLHSPPHREAIIRSDWREIGISLIRVPRIFGQAEVALWVSNFGAH